ncbi:MAG: hypothetical protein ABI885_29295 [Gammaproteobacteria bacterium]
MRRKSHITQQPPRCSTDEMDRLAHAMAFVILQRQMRGKWTSELRLSKTLHV